MGVGLLLEAAGLLGLSLLLLLGLLLLFQPLFPLTDSHELDPPLLSTQNHLRWRGQGCDSARRKGEKENNG